MVDLATHDELTGLFNRQAFTPLYEQSVLEARRNGEPLSVVLFDIDHFKKINDSHGHLIGDRVIVSVAQAAREAVRSADSIYRWGGEEFLVLLRRCSMADAADVGEKIRLRVAESQVGAVQSTVSLGVATLKPEDTMEGLLSRADAAMYRAKNAGRNRLERN